MLGQKEPVEMLEGNWLTPLLSISNHKQENHDFQTPMDIVNGATSVSYQFIDGINTGNNGAGSFSKTNSREAGNESNSFIPIF